MRFVSLAPVLAAACCAGLASAQACRRPGPDLVIGIINDIGNYTVVDGRDAIALGTVVCNNGSVEVNFTGCSNNTHPVIAGHAYRYTTVDGAGRFEQMGLSWVKHATTALAQALCCSCQGQSTGHLGVGCSDTYGSGLNGGQLGLGPRYTINVYTGAFPIGCTPHPSGGNAGRIEIPLADITPTAGGPAATTRYFGETQIIAADDATWTDATHPVPLLGLNNTSSIELTVSGTPANYSFALMGGSGTTMVATSAVRRWKMIDPYVSESVVAVPGEGTFIVCSRATALPGGLWHYEYAVYNMNSDRCGGEFHVPVPGDVPIFNAEFHGVVHRGGDGEGGVNYDATAWLLSRSAEYVSWSTEPAALNPNANAIRWGTTCNFRFDADAPPAAGTSSAVLTLWKPGSPAVLSVPIQGPSATPCDRADYSLDGNADLDDVAFLVNAIAGGVNLRTLDPDFNRDGNVDQEDIAALILVVFGGPC